MTDMGGYRRMDVLRRDAELELSRGRNADGAAVLVLTPVSEQPAPATRRRLHHEFGLRQHLAPDWAATPLALHEAGGRPNLVLADPGGVPLERLIAGRGGPVGRDGMADWLRLCAAMASALAAAHDRDLIHKDINPANFLVDPATGTVRLTGFGVASRMPRESLRATPTDAIVGTFPYMAPEQTGRMNRSVDQRSDLYALGVTCYEALTGQRPFTAGDPMEWVHCHIARQPVPPAHWTADLPGPVCDIVMKLLAKMAEDRYQTAAGLAADLQRCLAEWDSTGSVRPFALAANDRSGRLTIPEILYGRESESRTLLDVFGRVAEGGRTALVLVSGYSGIGKSALVNQIQPAMVERRGLYGAGKFDQHKRDIPFATFAQAFQSLVRHVLSRDEAELAIWRAAILEAVGPNGRLLVDLIPPLEHLIGRQPPVPALAPTEAQARFRSVFRRFVAVFARPGQPLVLFLDDLQWMDAGSMKLLEDLMTHPDVRHLVLIGAYRDNEVDSTHPLMLSVETVRKGGGSVNDIVLAPLSRGDLGRMVAGTLRAAPDEAEPLAALIHEKTGGNPFFAIQFLTALADEKLVRFDAETGRWAWSVDSIAAKGFSDNVVDLMAAKLNRLPDPVRRQLRRVACHGSGVALATLAKVDGLTEDQAQADMEEAVRTGFLFLASGRLAFAHDRIQEAAYQSLPAAERPATHLAIGRRLLSRLSPAEVEEQVFHVVHQLNQGSALISDPGEKNALHRLNVMAGTKAKASTAYVSARSYFRQARALLPADAWERSSDDTFALLLELAECEYLVGNHDQADALFRRLLERATTDARRARVWRLRFRMTMVAGRFGDAVDIAVEALALFGLVCPVSGEAMADAVAVGQNELRALIGERPIASLVELPLCTDDAVRALIGVIADAIPAVYHVRPMLYPFLGLSGINLSLKHGVTEDSSTAFSGYSVSLVGRFEDFETGLAFSELALHLDERFGSTQLRGTLLFRHGYFVSPWRRPIGECMPFLEESFRACLETGNLVYAAYTAYASAWMWLEKGEPLDFVLATLRKYAPFAKTTRIGFASLMIRLQELFVTTLMGQPEEDAAATAADLLRALEDTKHGYGIAFYHVARQITPYLMGDWPAALAAGRATAPLVPKISSSVIEVSHHLFQALAMTALYPQAEPAERREFLDALAEHRRKLKLWAESCPQTFGCRSLLVEAEMARIEDRETEALRLYERAIAAARDNGLLAVEAIANERAGTFCRDRGLPGIAETYLGNARYGFERWGALAKVRQLDALYPRLPERDPAPTAESAVFRGGVEGLDLMTVVKAQQAVSGEIVLARLVEALLRIVVEHAGADTGLLILPHGDGYRIEAKAETRGDRIEVRTLAAVPGADDLPVSVFQYVVRSRERVVLDDASASNPFATAAFATRTGVKSLLCLPVVTHGRLAAVLYLENRLATAAFTENRVAVLDLLASQASISLENATLYAEMEERVRARTRELAASLDTVRAKSDQVASLLDNSGQGFLSFGRDMIVDAEYSRACVDMLGVVPAGRDVCPMLWEHEPATAELMRQATDIALGDDDPLKSQMMIGLLPKEIRRGAKILKAEYKILDNRHMMLVLTDISEEKRLEDTVEAERRHMEMVVAAITDGHDFFDAVSAFRAFAETDLDEMLASTLEPAAIVQEIYRQVHTFKGLLSQFAFTRTPAVLHDLEGRLDSLRRRREAPSVAEIAAVARAVPYLDRLDADLEVVRDVLGREFLDNGERILLTAAQARRLRRLAADLASGRPVDTEAPDLRALLRDVGELGKVSLFDALRGHDALVQRIAERCEKDVGPIRVSGDDVRVDPEPFGPLLRVLGHVFRNAVDHGIEPPEDRLEAGKDEVGIIECAVRDLGEAVRIDIADDGAGIDLDALRNRAIAIRGREAVARLSDDAVLDLVFADGMTTRAAASEVSGRGVGMAAVRAAVLALGGRLEARSEPGRGARFILTLPKPGPESGPESGEAM